MRYVSAYLLPVLGGNTSHSSKDISTILGSVGIEAEDDLCMCCVWSIALHFLYKKEEVKRKKLHHQLTLYLYTTIPYHHYYPLTDKFSQGTQTCVKV
uniref:Large ribosomal subunit protein P2 n=1 Tax=Salmo trutta TaxID=8032 RepID=A0A673YD99_SALTR